MRKVLLLLGLVVLSVSVTFGQGNKKKKKKKRKKAKMEMVDTAQVYRVVEQMPILAICDIDTLDELSKKECSDQTFLTNLYQNITYPDSARINNIEGTVVASFTVEMDGTISDAKIVKDIGQGCGDEVLRVINTFNEGEYKWKPGVIKNTNVKTSMTIPVRFKIEEPAGTKQNLFAFYIFCRDFAGDFFDVDFLVQLSEQDIDDQNLCEPGIRVTQMTLTYSTEGQEDEVVTGEGWSEDIKALLKKASSGDSFKLDYILEAGSNQLEINKVLMVN